MSPSMPDTRVSDSIEADAKKVGLLGLFRMSMCVICEVMSKTDVR